MSTTVQEFIDRATAAYRAELASLVDELGAPEADPVLVGVRGAVASAAEQLWVSEVGPFLDTSGAAVMLGGVTKQAVSERVRRRRLLALRMGPGGRALRFPIWQFDGATLELLARVLEAVGYDPGTAWHGGLVAAWLCAPDRDLDGVRPRDLLASGHLGQVLARAGDVRGELGVEEGAVA